jgi:hypothetical protein
LFAVQIGWEEGALSSVWMKNKFHDSEAASVFAFRLKEKLFSDKQSSRSIIKLVVVVLTLSTWNCSTENLKERDHLGDIGSDGRIILKLT